MRSVTCSLRRTAALLSLLALAAAPAAGTISPEAAAEMLRRSDVASLAPASFRARLRITAPGQRPEPMEIEVWRSGEAKSLVRFLGAKESGKYLLRLEDVVWFLAPGARKPLKISPARRLRGSASLDDILGIRYGLEYDIKGVEETEDDGGPLVVMDLAARNKRALYPRVTYVVRRSTQRPARVEHLLPSGKTASIVEFLEWEEGARPVARRLVIADPLHGGLKTEVTLLEMEERPIPEGLFDLLDPAERRKLEGPHGPSGRPAAPRPRG